MVYKLAIISIIIVALTIVLLGFKYFNKEKYNSCTCINDKSDDKPDAYKCICNPRNLKRNGSK